MRDVNRDWLADRHGERFNEVCLYIFQFWLKSNRESRIVCMRKSGLCARYKERFCAHVVKNGSVRTL